MIRVSREAERQVFLSHVARRWDEELKVNFGTNQVGARHVGRKFLARAFVKECDPKEIGVFF